MKTKTKTKLVVSICALTLIFSACKKDAVTPEPALDCMGIESGTAIIDDCNDCHKWTAYNYVTHVVREVNDTVTEVLADNEMFASPNNPMNPLWNASCTDCMGIESGTAIIDDCNDCHKWTAYNYVTHVVREVNDTVTEVLADNEMFASPNNPMNPLWNASCTDCSGILNGSAISDDCDDCHKWLAYNYVFHTTREVNDTINEVLLDNEMFTTPNNAMNPLWNAGCK